MPEDHDRLTADGLALGAQVSLPAEPWLEEEAALTISPVEPVVELPPELAQELLSEATRVVSAMENPRAPGDAADLVAMPDPEAIAAAQATTAGESEA